MKKYFSNQQTLQDYGILFENIKTQTELKSQLAEYGYDDAEVQKGKALYDKAQEVYQKNIKEGQEETTAYAQFTTEFEQLLKTYKTDRKKAKIIYKDQPETLKNLRLKGQSSRQMANLLDEVNIFYHSLKEDSALLSPLNRLKITEESVEAQLTQLQKTQKAYATYTQEKGESQDATKQKNAAFSDLEKWVKEFYSIAKIALEDRPQLLESIAKFVRS
ncbi:hypothetical protein [Riemerella anatipestifer]|uniref:Uncharacterized protein n=2 Tax=Riemerella anatipestifer TaxID=34085 RepID=J9QZE7_RIEAN|nr:hypothetical protein [Riemerella anatipestifer]AFR36020.1 hypothetical protein B739_1422 [Riemerella anatipestifer RA-CH-1]AIH03013.1 hypothetical protein M949_1846 [Riemerella anatipestifer CH3]AQY21290.1 hypothetical protein AB406_0330 [Riemerella anatipestifer]AZZ58247.1 hypothetical protein AWB57_03890 [Riemerella anatipestifer]MBT0550493.1 hypothetical protein [Riemerella anatipestifer]